MVIKVLVGERETRGACAGECWQKRRVRGPIASLGAGVEKMT